MIHEKAIIGDSFIGPYCVIGTQAETRLHDHEPKNPTIIGDDNMLFKLVTVDEGAEIGDNNTLMAHSHVGHDATIGNSCIVATGAVIGGHCVIENNCYLGLNSTLHPRSLMGKGSLLAAGSFGKGVLEPYWIYAGVPAKPIKPNYKRMNEDRLSAKQIEEIQNNETVIEQKLGWKRISQ